MKTYTEQKTKILALATKEAQLALIFEWVKTGVTTKNQFIALMTEIELEEESNAAAMEMRRPMNGV